MNGDDRVNLDAARASLTRELAHLRHELRTPLNAILGYSELLLEDAGEEWPREITEGLAQIHNSGKFLVSLVDDLLAPARSGADTDLESVSNAIRQQLRAPLTAILGITDHLLGKAEPAGLGDCCADLQRIRASGQKLLALSDAIPAGQPEWGADTATPPSHVSTTQDSGATVPNPTVRVCREAASECGSLLVVDDNENNREILSRLLERRGHRVEAAAGGHQALAMLSARHYDLVLLDILMPDLNGYQILQRMKADRRQKEVPVIFISALDDVSGKVRAFQAGGADYVTKPFQVEEVIARVENQMKLSRLQKELLEQNQELVRKNEELVQAQKRTNLVFSALAEVLPGTVLDEKYRIKELIGTGGFGAVYSGVHLGLDLPVAVKVFRPVAGNDTPDALQRFRHEGIAASRVKHPNAVEILDNGISASGIAYLVMELLRGHTLAQEMRDEGTLTPQRTAEILAPVCAALAEIHAAGIVHRDIKPENIYLHQSARGEVVKLLDFGISKMLGAAADQTAESMTTTRSFAGTPGFMAPERLMNRPYDGRSDIYSLGIMMYWMLTGTPPFESKEGGGFVLAMMHLTADPPSLCDRNPALPRDLDTLVQRMLSRDPPARPTATELAGLIRAILPADPKRQKAQ